jgi:hypothetical protein
MFIPAVAQAPLPSLPPAQVREFVRRAVGATILDVAAIMAAVVTCRFEQTVPALA